MPSGFRRNPRQGEVKLPEIVLDGYTIGKQNRFWRVIDPRGELICLTVYKRGATEVVRRLREPNAVRTFTPDFDLR